MSYDRVWGFNLWDILVNNYFVKDELLNIIDIINEKQIELPDANTRGIYFYIYVAKREPKLIRVFSDIIVKHNFMYRFCVNFVRDDLELLVHVPSEIKTENFYKEAILMSSEFPKSFLNLIPDEIKTKDFYSRLMHLTYTKNGSHLL